MFAAVCVLLSAVGHILMSGRAVPGSVLFLAFAGTMALAWLSARRERGLPAVTAAAVAVQSVLHTVFSWSRPADALSADAPPGDAPLGNALPAAGAHAVMDHMHAAHAAMGHEAVSRAGAAITESPAAHDMTDMTSSFGMLSAHLLAAALSGLWMAYGERAVFRVLRALPLGLFRPLRMVLAAVVPVLPRLPRVRPDRAGDERAPRRLLLAHSVISRGPPQAIAVL